MEQAGIRENCSDTQLTTYSLQAVKLWTRHISIQTWNPKNLFWSSSEIKPKNFREIFSTTKKKRTKIKIHQYKNNLNKCIEAKLHLPTPAQSQQANQHPNRPTIFHPSTFHPQAQVSRGLLYFLSFWPGSEMVNFLKPCHWKRRFTTALLEDRWDVSLKGWVKLYHLQVTPLIF